ncbi:hypothetical protein B4168_1923 [Anoxybacillus flavithermus]|nr:hypothetical protein B4168_1923 [Anoxybacillus flavithermus]OAO85580.1 hypothetical protein GT23_2483 [Parageobacillus thermoglucosidasius]
MLWQHVPYQIGIRKVLFICYEYVYVVKKTFFLVPRPIIF